MTTHLIKLPIGIILLMIATAAQSVAGEWDGNGGDSQTRRFPADQVVSVSPDNRSFTVQLDALAVSIQDSISRCIVEVVDPHQKRRLLKVNEDGSATVENAEEGLYVVIAANEVAFGAIVIACRENLGGAEKGDEKDLYSLNFEDSNPNSTAVLMVIPVREQEIRPVVKNNFPSFPSILPTVLDRTLIEEQLTTPAAENIVQLGKGGAFRGKLTSVVKATSRYSGVEGTLVVVYKDGNPVGKTTANGIGQFQINGLKPGVHGVVVAGRGGFAAFGVEAVEGEGLINRPLHGRGFSYAQLMNDGEVLPVVLAPPTIFTEISDSIASIYDGVRLDVQKTETMLAQKSRLDAEDQQALEDVRTAFANEKRAEVTPRPSPRRSRSRILPESPVQASQSELPFAIAEKNDRPNVPINQLRLSAKDGSKAPFNPLRGN